MHRLVRLINKLEDGFLVSLLTLMVTLAVVQIVYRNLFDAGLSWADPLLRVLVLWVALAGAVIATRTDNHIRIDYFTRYFSPQFCEWMQRLVYLFCIIVCSIISWHSARFVYSEYEYQTIAFAGVPAWVTALIIPIGFGLMAIRYLALLIHPPRPEPTL